MVDRIVKNEERFDSILVSIKKLEDALEEFKMNKKNIYFVNKYYGSKGWFLDRKLYDSGEFLDVKAGVLSEDGVWNMLDDVEKLIIEMREIVDNYNINR